MTPDSERMDALRRFAEGALAATLRIEPASADASFRSYWRASANGATHVVMDAPPDKEDLAPWLDIDARLRKAGLHAPEVVAVDREQGFIVMEDLGSRTYLPELTTGTVDAMYADALDALLRMQTHADPAGLPHFDEAFVTRELELMPEWFMRRHLGREIGCDEWDVIELAFRALIQGVSGQPQTFMHRDYHSRNLLVVPEHNPGIIDFQGAMIGPVAYDLASLLRDCYIAWDPEHVQGWADGYRERLRGAHLIDEHVDAGRFRRWFDFAGLQRHIKVLGLFCRLCYRDGKPQYLGDLPRVGHYVASVARHYPEIAPLGELVERAIGAIDLTQPRAETAR